MQTTPGANTLTVTGLSVEFRTSERIVQAVRDLSFEIGRGETVAIVGESGSGKSVTALSLMRLVEHGGGRITSGKLEFTRPNGDRIDLAQASGPTMRSIRGAEIAMIFQVPMTSLNPVFPVGEQIAESIRLHQRMDFAAARREALRMLVQVRIPDAASVLSRYPHQLSGGMRQRVMIAMAIVNRPELLIADEPTTALDVTIQAQILDLLAGLREKFGLTMLFISHDLAVISNVADNIAVMYAGTLVEIGSRDDIFRAPAHPYTRGLLAAAPTLTTDRDRPLQTIEGTVPPLHAMPSGCLFEPRCEFRIPECARAQPPLVEVSPGHWARCPVINPAT